MEGGGREREREGDADADGEREKVPDMLKGLRATREKNNYSSVCFPSSPLLSLPPSSPSPSSSVTQQREEEEEEEEETAHKHWGLNRPARRRACAHLDAASLNNNHLQQRNW